MKTAPVPSLAIAGAWGYIGQKFLDAGRQLGLAISVYDPGEVPQGIDLNGVTCFGNEADFFRQDADIFHLALHPEHRSSGVEILLERSQSEQLCLLCEKPMAAPDRPGDCRSQVVSFDRSPLLVLYDFPELYDPITWRVIKFLQDFELVEIDSIVMQRSKDREDPLIERNEKRMVHIQYQESVHCLAFAINLLGQLAGELPAVFRSGLQVSAAATAYSPPNPSAYPYVVDGRCEYRLELGGVHISGLTDFTRGAPWAKRRTIIGRGDGRPFRVEIDFLEGQKTLSINGQAVTDAITANSYIEVIRSIARWQETVKREVLMTGVYPNPRFAWVTYQLSSLLWKSSWDGREMAVQDLDELLSIDVEFAKALPTFARY